jgi:hypothetical protein
MNERPTSPIGTDSKGSYVVLDPLISLWCRDVNLVSVTNMNMSVS